MFADADLLRLLEGTRTLLADPTRWTRGVLSKDAAGVYCLPNSPSATCWCVLGGLHKTCRDLNLDQAVYFRAIEVLNAECPGGAVSFNDNRGHRAVLMALDRAIQYHKGPGQEGQTMKRRCF